jgi:phage gp16-like protein
MITYQALAAEAEARWQASPARLLKAVEIASSRCMIYNQRCPQGEYDVRSQTALNSWHHVDTNRHTCTCKDSQTGHVCKHRLAVWLYVEQRKREQLEAYRSGAGQINPQREQHYLAELGY